MSRPFTLFHLDGERGFRGGERQLVYLAAELRARGHANVVACRRGSPLEARARALGLEVLNLPFLGEWDPVSALRLRAAAARRPGAILHAHTGHAAALAFLASRFGGAARVAHRRVDFRLSGAASARLKYASAGRVVAVSEAVRELLVEDGVPARRVRVVPDCLPLSEEEARRAGETDWMRPPTSAEREAARAALSREFSLNLDEPWIGCLAALVPHKDHATLLRAFALVAAARPCRLLLAGEGPLEGELKELARALGVEFRVLFAGQQARPLVWLHAVDLFALSSWGEGMGSVLLEAMACGVPIAATRAGGIPEAAPDGSCALLAPPRDPKALADALLACLADPAGAARRAEEARRRVRSFGSAEAARRMEDVYEEALS